MRRAPHSRDLVPSDYHLFPDRDFQPMMSLSIWSKTGLRDAQNSFILKAVKNAVFAMNGGIDNIEK